MTAVEKTGSGQIPTLTKEERHRVFSETFADIARRTAKNMTAAERAARARLGGYARPARKYGVSVEAYIEAKKTADQKGIPVEEVLAAEKRKPTARSARR